MRPVQFFSAEYLAQAQNLTPSEIADFLDQYLALMSSQDGKRKLISLRVPEQILSLFKQKSKLTKKPYQTQIVDLMRHWIETT